MKIAIVQGAFLPVPPLLGGAVEKIWFEMGQQFADLGHEVTHISRAYGNLPPTEEINGVRHVRVKGFDTPSSGSLLKAMDLVYSSRAFGKLPKSDIVVTNTFFMPVFLGNARRGRVMVDVQRMPKGQMRFYRRAACLRGNSSAVVAAILRDDFRAQGRTVMIPNPLSSTRQALALSHMPKEKVILYAGRIHPEKGIELLLQAFLDFTSRFKSDQVEWSLRLAGPWETAQGGGGVDLANALRNRYGSPRITWLGPIFDAEALGREYERASIFAYPSLAEKGETFGVSVLEAMAWGAVPVVSDLECFRDFVHEGENGLFFNHRSSQASEALADCFHALATQPEKLADMGFKAQSVNETHSPRRIALQLIEQFERMGAA